MYKGNQYAPGAIRPTLVPTRASEQTKASETRFPVKDARGGVEEGSDENYKDGLEHKKKYAFHHNPCKQGLR